MTGHDPRAAAVLASYLRFDGHVWCESCKCTVLPDRIYAEDAATYALDALAAADPPLVVRPADEYEQVEWGWSDDCCVRPVLYGDWPDDPDHRPLYVRKENPNG